MQSLIAVALLLLSAASLSSAEIFEKIYKNKKQTINLHIIKI